jgi:hypothetical protein
MWGIQRTSTLPVEAGLVLYSIGECGNTALSLFLQCAVCHYIPQWIIAEHLSFLTWMDTLLSPSVLWQSCDMYCSRCFVMHGALLSEPLLSIFSTYTWENQWNVCQNCPYFWGSIQWTMNFITENGSRLKRVCHFVPISCRLPHMHLPPQVQSFVYHSQCSFSGAKHILPCCNREWRA